MQRTMAIVRPRCDLLRVRLTAVEHVQVAKQPRSEDHPVDAAVRRRVPQERISSSNHVTSSVLHLEATLPARLALENARAARLTVVARAPFAR